MHCPNGLTGTLAKYGIGEMDTLENYFGKDKKKIVKQAKKSENE